jgi:hypothetical protein
LTVWNPIEGAAYAFVFAYESAALAGLRGQLTEAQDGWVPTLRAISAMLVWLRILKYVSMFPRAGHLVNIVVKMLFEFMIFLIVFFTIFAAFTHAVRARVPRAAARSAHARSPRAPRPPPSRRAVRGAARADGGPAGRRRADRHDRARLPHDHGRL